MALQEALSEKERTQEQLIRSESLAAIRQLVAGSAHELNNPLTSVTSLIQSTIEDLSQWDNSTLLDQDLIDNLRFADKELGRARLIVASLLGLSRQTQTYEEAVNLNLVIQDGLMIQGRLFLSAKITAPAFQNLIGRISLSRFLLQKKSARKQVLSETSGGYAFQKMD